MEQPPITRFEGCTIPPDIYDIAFAWDPRPEVNRLLFLAREWGLMPGSALELGCGTARLFPEFSKLVPDLCGIELNPTMAAIGRRRVDDGGAPAPSIIAGDMSDFSLCRSFDLIYSSANTIRHVLTEHEIRRLWRCVADHMVPGGLFIADLELGVAAEAAKVGKPATWFMARDDFLVHATWLVTRPPDPVTRICGIEWSFESREEARPGVWRQSFDLRTYDANDFAALATEDGRLALRGIYEIREPYLVPAKADSAEGRHLVVLQRVGDTPAATD